MKKIFLSLLILTSGTNTFAAGFSSAALEARSVIQKWISQISESESGATLIRKFRDVNEKFKNLPNFSEDRGNYLTTFEQLGKT